MAHLATPDFLSSLKALYPPQSTYVKSPWYAIAAVTFSASNCPEAVPLVLKYVLDDLHAIAAPHEDRLAAARNIREALFKSGFLCGFPKVINALVLLHEATPPELRDTKVLRKSNPSFEELLLAGQALFDQTYGETAQATQELLHAIYPDLGYTITSIAYGYVYAFSATSAMETSLVLLATLITLDTPRQIKWHLDGAIRNGATREEVSAVRAMAIQIATAAGIVWQEDVPDLS